MKNPTLVGFCFLQAVEICKFFAKYNRLYQKQKANICSPCYIKEYSQTLQILILAIRLIVLHQYVFYVIRT